MRIVVALGGNALLKRGERPDASVQLHHVHAAAGALAVLGNEHELIVCHGNGPQVGLLALESEADRSLTRPYPLDVLGAQTQGMIGYWLVQSLRNAGLAKPAVALVTQTVVDATDPAFAEPTKFVGSVYDEPEAEQLRADHGWAFARDGERWRRVVPSPEPTSIVEQDCVDALVAAGALVVCGGGGGVPVADDGAGGLRGVEAVVDKDLTAAVIARSVDADRLLVLTDVPAVMRDFGTARARPIDRLYLDELDETAFPAGSMGPKVAAARRFVAATGHPATIGALDDATAVLAGSSGTTVLARP